MNKNVLSLTLFFCAGLLTPAVAGAPAGAKTNAFFPFCIDTHDAKKRNLEQQAQMLKELGYDGVGHLWLDNIPERLKTLDAAGLKLFQITITVDITPGKQAYDPRFKEVMPLLKGRGVQFLLLMSGLKPSDPAGDARAVEIIREMAGMAAESGAQVLLYPHSNDWLERIEDAVRVAEKVDRPNVGVMFNLCHWLRVSKSRDYKPLLAHAMPRLWAVSINGADEFDDQARLGTLHPASGPRVVRYAGVPENAAGARLHRPDRIAVLRHPGRCARHAGRVHEGLARLLGPDGIEPRFWWRVRARACRRVGFPPAPGRCQPVRFGSRGVAVRQREIPVAPPRLAP